MEGGYIPIPAGYEEFQQIPGTGMPKWCGGGRVGWVGGTEKPRLPHPRARTVNDSIDENGEAGSYISMTSACL